MGIFDKITGKEAKAKAEADAKAAEVKAAAEKAAAEKRQRLRKTWLK